MRRVVPRILASILFAVLSLTVVGGAQHRAPGPPQKDYVPGEVIVRFLDSAPVVDRGTARARIGAQRIHTFRSGAEHWKLPPGLTVEEAVERLSREPWVRYAEPNFIVHMEGDPLLGEQWSLINTGQTGGVPDADIDADLGWSIATGSHTVVVAVIDAGVDYLHPDLGANMWVNPGETINGIDDDGNGYVDDTRGWDFLRHDNNPSPYDLTNPSACELVCNHGTHVAGIAGAVGNNDVGVAGVAWNVSLMPLRIADSGCSSSTADAIDAIEYATDKGADVINASWGIGTVPSQELEVAIAAAGQQGIAFVAAAGNANSDNDALPRYPSSYTLANIISVASTDASDLKGPGSNYGLTSVDLGAPGVSILSTIPRRNCPPPNPPCEDECPPEPPPYALLSGTSMAAPHVTGAISLFRSLKPALPVACMKQILLETTDPLPDLSGRTVSGGRLNLFGALQEVAADDDADGISNVCDNCPSDYNPAQNFVGNPVVHVVSPNGWQTFTVNDSVTLTWTASDSCGGVASVDLLLSRNGPSGSFSTIAAGIANTGSYLWTVTGPPTTQAYLKVVARDPAGNTGYDVSDAAFTIQRLCTVCQGTYCSEEGLRCTAVTACMSGSCCQYSCGPDPSCIAPDPCPENACGCF